jgi:hypothetical protein
MDMPAARDDECLAQCEVCRIKGAAIQLRAMMVVLHKATFWVGSIEYFWRKKTDALRPPPCDPIPFALSKPTLASDRYEYPYGGHDL